MNIPIDLTSKDLENFPVGEYSFACIGTEVVLNESGQMDAVVLKLSCQDPEFIGKPLNHRLSTPQPGDTPEKVYMKKKTMKDTCAYFRVPFTAEGFNHEEFVGKTCMALVRPVTSKKDDRIFDNVARWL